MTDWLIARMDEILRGCSCGNGITGYGMFLRTVAECTSEVAEDLGITDPEILNEIEGRVLEIDEVCTNCDRYFCEECEYHTNGYKELVSYVTKEMGITTA